MKVFIGSDHGGTELRDELASALASWGHEVLRSFGPATSETSVDYPDVAVELCDAVAREGGSVGVLVCGTGLGVAITANKRPGIRAGTVNDSFSARMLREHNDGNVICFGARVIGPELAKVALQAYLGASFGGGRHQRRVDKITAAETDG